MTKPIRKTEVVSEYPDQHFVGKFAHPARFEVTTDQTGLALTLERCGLNAWYKSVRMHFHYLLLAEILRDLAKTVAAFPPDEIQHRDALRDTAKTLCWALETNPDKVKKFFASAA
jgi:hypothetical protein